MENPAIHQKTLIKLVLKKEKLIFGVLADYLLNNLFAMEVIKKKENLNQLNI